MAGITGITSHWARSSLVRCAATSSCFLIAGMCPLLVCPPSTHALSVAMATLRARLLKRVRRQVCHIVHCDAQTALQVCKQTLKRYTTMFLPTQSSPRPQSCTSFAKVLSDCKELLSVDTIWPIHQRVSEASDLPTIGSQSILRPRSAEISDLLYASWYV
jgi:hypothetical protein